MAAILNSAILHSTILHKKNFTHSFWLNLMMVAILNSAILHSTILHKTLTQSNSIWLKLLHSHSTWWWQPSWIWPSWIQPSDFFLSNSPTLAKIGSHHFQKKKKLHLLFPLHHLCKILHSFNLINLMMAAILNSAILDSAILNKTLTQTNSIWLKLLHSHSTWWWQPSWIWPSWIQPFCTKKTSLIHSHSTWWWQPSWILSTWIPPSWIQPS